MVEFPHQEVAQVDQRSARLETHQAEVKSARVTDPSEGQLQAPILVRVSAHQLNQDLRKGYRHVRLRELHHAPFKELHRDHLKALRVLLAAYLPAEALHRVRYLLHLHEAVRQRVQSAEEVREDLAQADHRLARAEVEVHHAHQEEDNM